MDRKVVKNLTAWERVEIARKQDRPNALYYIKNICSNFLSFMETEPFQMTNQL